MSYRPQPITSVPEETNRVARAAFPTGTLAMDLRDALAGLYTDQDFADLFAARGQAAECPWRLAVVTVLQFLEGLTDRQAADAVRSRIDWKYLLGLELTDTGFHFTVRHAFRRRQGPQRRPLLGPAPLARGVPARHQRRLTVPR